MAVRQRKKRSNNRPTESSSSTLLPDTTKTGASKEEEKDDSIKEEEEEESVWETIKSHWSIRAIVLIGSPLFLYYGRLYLLLQKPHWLPSSLELRPGVSMDEERQVLIVGTMSSGTSSISHQLSSIFHLEVEHESTDTLWEYTRDGTVSWFHGIRFLKYDSNTDKHAKILQICHVAYSYIASPFHYNHPYAAGPKLFGSLHYQCSPLSPNFKQCFFQECFRLIQNELGCALPSSLPEQQTKQKKKKECAIPFRKTLFQTREPIRIAESLVVKYCITDEDEITTANMSPPPHDLLYLFDAILPHGKFLDSHTRSCPQHMLTYVLLYYTMLLDAYDDTHPPNNNKANNNPHQMDAIYPIESTPLCQVVQLSGLLDAKTAVYTPNYIRVKQMCDDGVGMIGKSKNVINKNRKFKIEKFDVEKYGLVEDLKGLYDRLGYIYPF